MKSIRSQVTTIPRAPRQRSCVAALVLGVAVAAPGYAAVNEFVIGMVASGTAPFSTSSGPGLDQSKGDTAVRTNDQFAYRVGYSLAPADTNRVVTLSMGATTLPAGYVGPALTPKDIAYFSPADIPTGANGCANVVTTPVPWPAAAGATQSGVSADGQHIVCVQPSNASGANMDFVARVGGAAPNGTTIAPPTPTFKSTNNPGPYPAAPRSGVFGDTTLYGTPTLTVSAAPRWKVQKTAVGGGVFIPGSGPAGEDGYVTVFNIGVYASGSRKGLEALQPDYLIREDFNDVDMPNARLLNWNVNSPGYATLPMGAGAEHLQQNGCGDWRSQLLRLGNSFDNVYNQPGDTGATSAILSSSVARGGTCMATNVDQGAKTANLALKGTDFSLTHYPLTRGNAANGTLVNAGDLEASSNEWWVASKSVLVWVPVGDLTANVTEELTNKTSIEGASVTGQANPPSSASANATFLRQTGGSHSKIYSAPQTWAHPAGEQATVCDPNVSGDCWVNQAAPGQLVAARINSVAQSQGFQNGYICEKIDNARFTFEDLRTRSGAAGALIDPATGVATRYASGSAAASPLTFELGVGTWATRSNTTNEYHSTANPQPATTTGAQALSTCADAEMTWYPSIDALTAAGRQLSEVKAVRANYANYGAATQTLIYVPLRVNAQYTYSATETGGTTPAISAGQSTLDSYAPNQSVWMRGALPGLTPLKSSDALRIAQTEYAQITKSALAPHAINNGVVTRGAVVTYSLTVNLTSGTNAHRAPSVEVWDVIPPHLDIVPNSASFNGAAVTEMCWPKGVTPPAPSPFAAGSVGANYQACRWTLTDQPVAFVGRGVAAGNLPALTFRAVVGASAPVGTNLLNTAFADTPGNQLVDATYVGSAPGAPAGFRCPPGNGTCSFSNWNLIVSSDSGIVLDKVVSDATVPQNTGFSYGLTYAAIGTSLTDVRILDVLPVTTDGRTSAFIGSLRLAGPIAAPVAAAGPPTLSADPDIVIRYSVNTPANINRDPYHASQIITGTGTNSATTTIWCTVAQFGTGACPADASAATAFMAFPRQAAGGVISSGSAYRLQVPVVAAGNAVGDTYLNDFVADSPTLTARRPGSNTVLTTVTGVVAPGQSVSGRVYLENSTPPNTSDDGNAVDPGIGGVTVRLVCTAPAYDQTLTTAADGTFQFDNVTSGAVCTLTQTQPAGYANTYNTPGTGGSGQTGNTGTTDSTITLTVPNGGSSGNLFAETLNGPPNADMTSTVVCTPNPAAPGAAVSCTVTCTNNGPADALGAMCTMPNAPTLPGAPTPVCSPSGTVVAGASLSCKVDFTMPTTPGTTVDVQGGTGAQNDRNGGNDAVAGNNPSTTRVSNQPTVPVPTLGWPALALLGAALGALGMCRRRSA